MEQVDLRKLFPDAEEGQCCLVEFDIASKSEDDGIIKISNSVDVYIDDVKVYARGTEQEAYVHIPVRVGKIKKNIKIKCYCENSRFGFEYLLSSKVYPFMWAVDYLLHIRRTLPILEYNEEEGIAVSELFSDCIDYPADLCYVFPTKR